MRYTLNFMLETEPALFLSSPSIMSNVMFALTCMYVVSFCHASNTRIFVDPLVKLDYGSGSEYQWTQFSGHHAISEPSTSQADTIKGLNVFPSRWLKPDATYFDQIPAISGTNLPDLTWFDDPNNQNLVLQAYPTYLTQFGDDNNEDNNYDLIYCIGGCTWPSYMLANDEDFIPFNYSAATSLITKSLEVLYSNTSRLPKFFEPQNEPFTPYFGNSTLETRVKFQNYINNEVFKQFSSISKDNDKDKNGENANGLIIGGPAMDGVQWFKIVYNPTSFLFDQTFGVFIKNGIRKIENLDKFFISWHQFSQYVVVNNSLCEGFYGSGTVSATMDLIESYLNSFGLINNVNINGKILISEHGLALDPGDGVMNLTNDTYLGYVATNVYLTDLMLFLERPESQFKSNAFYLTGNTAVETRYPLVIVDVDDIVTPTGKMYYIQSLLKENGGNFINSTVVYGDNGGHSDDIRVFSLYNNVTGKLIIVIKEIAWEEDQTINVNINNWSMGMSGGVNGNYHTNTKKTKGAGNMMIRRIYWDTKTGEILNYNYSSSLNSNGTISLDLHTGETIALYDISYQVDAINTSKKNLEKKINKGIGKVQKEKEGSVKVSTTTICRSRYYSSNFSVKTMDTAIEDSIKIDAADDGNFLQNFEKGILRIAMSWDTVETSNTNDFDKLLPTSVIFNGVKLDLSLQRIDRLNKCGPMGWISFEYEVTKDVFNSKVNNQEYLAEFKFAQQTDYVYITSVVSELYSLC